MIQTPGLWLYILAFMLVIGPLVFVHEMGHYLAGRWFGVKADAFSIGFGREIFGVTDKRGTRWKFGWLPLGGYVKFAGDMNPASQPDAAWLALPAAERAQTFQAKPVWQRAIIVAAGPVVNFVLAVLILSGFAMAYGENRTPPVIAMVAPGSAAAHAGLAIGDRITSLGGRAVETFNDIRQYTVLRPQERVAIEYQRNGVARSAEITIGAAVERDRFGNEFRKGQLGIAGGSGVYQPVGFLEAPGVGVRMTGETLRSTLDALGQIISGRRSVSELGGPLRIAKVSGEQLSLGVPTLILLMAFVSINLGFINLLPVPMLDGGHLFFYAIEAVRRRPVKPEVQEWAFRGGLTALLALMILVTFNDLGAFGLWKNLAGLIG
ncbi:RIP metalloprotease RseP [Sphingomonas sp. So64.6b]|uniref:RIP metalloprotease RseP n=1 Tax=Sphingomonas sp. So64.6b TaxID=2997354 RepID=UPI001600EDBC|nr:RIP metalloprotease RseP [Sphingomonas sp. So64.6b]QNA83900.1 RIP metalloprotease RseP [Sphingomonas sp. So64.6b]